MLGKSLKARTETSLATWANDCGGFRKQCFEGRGLTGPAVFRFGNEVVRRGDQIGCDEAVVEDWKWGVNHKVSFVRAA